MPRLQVSTVSELYLPGSDGLVVLPERDASLDPLPGQDARNPVHITLPHLFKLKSAVFIGDGVAGSIP